MDRTSFDRLLDTIIDNPVFYNISTQEQTPARYQLAVYLYCPGGGSSGSTLRLATSVGIGEGSVKNFCNRVVAALLSMRSKLIWWPTIDEKNAIKQGICAASKGVFPGCVDFIDGTFITLQ
ncbi:hypothetical protein EDC01DRAFT_611807 [Geopyxis carbonaria]|nr:hypothetical protein EDC01DRAFT_611807 [Geopyxis carbonaria]